ncbi:MAG: hypothetical protein N4A53_02880 [Pelagimonas sp.]|jgi:hypothetical protein|nr:hypothetical protein [Pelagimonas sp.]
MSQTEELQARVARALDRIATGLDSWEPAHVAAELAAARAETERALDSAEEARQEAITLRGELEALQNAPAPDPEPAEDPAELAELRSALEDERMAGAQMAERLRLLETRAGSDTAELRDQLSAQREASGLLEEEIRRVTAVNESLRATVEGLRKANAEGVGDPHLINNVMLEELEALRAARSAERAETEAVLSLMTPLLAQATGQDVPNTAPAPIEEDT